MTFFLLNQNVSFYDRGNGSNITLLHPYNLTFSNAFLSCTQLFPSKRIKMVGKFVYLMIELYHGFDCKRDKFNIKSAAVPSSLKLPKSFQIYRFDCLFNVLCLILVVTYPKKLEGISILIPQ